MLSKRNPSKRRWVVKAGSNALIEGGPMLVRSWMKDVKRLRDAHGIEVIWVTSGAIATAKERTAFSKKKQPTLAEKQALSAIGQPQIMDLYNLALQSTDLLGAQILLTSDDLANAARKKNFRNTAETLLKWGIVPVLNENDAVATEEIRFGDNDSLSARVARALGADRLVILTDVDGLYDADPRKNRDAKRVPVLNGVTEKTFALAGRGTGSSHGTGGMHSKLAAARIAGLAGIETWLLRGERTGILLQCARDETVGTRITVNTVKKRRGK